MVWNAPRAAPPGVAPPDSGPDFRNSLAVLEGPDRIHSLLKARSDPRADRTESSQKAAIAGYFSRYLVPDIRSDGGD